MAPLSLTSQIMTLIWQHSHLKCQTLLNIAINPDYSPTKQHSHPHFQLWATSYNLLCGCNTKGALPSKQCWLHPVSTTLNSQRNFRSWSWQDCFNHSDRKRSWTANLYSGKFLLILCLHQKYFLDKVREYCGLPSIGSFKELNNTVEDATIDLLASVYTHHDDIDLVVGGLAERPLSGAVVGPTFGCLLGQQFQILKKGDRFWYENNIPPSAFTKGRCHEKKLFQHRILKIISCSQTSCRSWGRCPWPRSCVRTWTVCTWCSLTCS